MSITDLTALPAAAAPEWLTRVGIPAGWRVGRYTGDGAIEPWSAAVRGGRADGTWDACETIVVFGFTGIPVAQDVWQLCESSLRALNADNIVVVEIDTPPKPGVSVVSGSGLFVVDDRLIHGQFNYYTVGLPLAGQGRMIQQCLYVESIAKSRVRGGSRAPRRRTSQRVRQRTSLPIGMTFGIRSRSTGMKAISQVRRTRIQKEKS